MDGSLGASEGQRRRRRRHVRRKTNIGDDAESPIPDGEEREHTLGIQQIISSPLGSSPSIGTSASTQFDSS